MGISLDYLIDPAQSLRVGDLLSRVQAHLVALESDDLADLLFELQEHLVEVTWEPKTIAGREVKASAQDALYDINEAIRATFPALRAINETLAMIKEKA
jgi:hypothetical protein